MDEIIAHIGKWLSEIHGSGRHQMYGAFQLLAVGVAITAALTAKDYAKKRKQLKERQTTTLATDCLSMTLLSNESGEPVKYVATLLRENEGYRLNVLKTSGASREMTVSEPFKTLDEAENHLRLNTPFLLSDFK